jgi:hypothetical protein
LRRSKSAGLRDRLLGELAAITDQEELTAWAHRSMATKNTLTTPDAARVETEFASRMAALPSAGSAEADQLFTKEPNQADGGVAEEAVPPGRTALMAALRASVELGAVECQRVSSPHDEAPRRKERANDATSWHIDKSTLHLSEPRRYRDREHLKFVSLQACVVCGRRPSDPHHLRFMQPRSIGRRVSDEFTVPLYRTHHRSLHRAGDEPAWWAARNLDPVAVAAKLWERSRLIDGTLVQRGLAGPSAISEGITPEAGAAGQCNPPVRAKSE